MWRFILRIAPDDSSKAYALLIKDIEGLLGAVKGEEAFEGVIAKQKYERWLPPGCYAPAGSTARIPAF